MTRPETLDRKFTSKLPPPALEFIKLLLSLDSTKRPTCTEVGRGCGGSSEGGTQDACHQAPDVHRRREWHAVWLPAVMGALRVMCG